MKKILWGILALVVIVLIVGGVWYIQLRSAARQWEGPVPEILSEKLEKDANVMEVEFRSRIDAPVADVYRAFTEPERLQEFSDIVRYAKLVRAENNHKAVEFEMVILGRPQRLTLEFSFFPQEHRIALKTIENPLSDVTGEYRLAPSPDGSKTLLTYTGVTKDKIQLPVPLALQKSAMREMFTSTIRALKKGLATQQQLISGTDS